MSRRPGATLTTHGWSSEHDYTGQGLRRPIVNMHYLQKTGFSSAINQCHVDAAVAVDVDVTLCVSHSMMMWV